MHPALQGLLTIAVGVGGCVSYFFLSNQFLDKVLFPPRGPNAGRNINRANLIRPWLFLFPAIAALGLYLAYPVFETLRMSLSERLPGNESRFVGLDNYRQMLSEPKFWEAMRNNILWLLVVPALSTVFGLLAAQLSATNLAHHTAMEQFFSNDRIGVDPNRIRYGHFIGCITRYS